MIIVGGIFLLAIAIFLLYCIASSYQEPKTESAKKLRENPARLKKSRRNTVIATLLFGGAGIACIVAGASEYGSSGVIAALIVCALIVIPIWFMAIGRYKLGETKFVQNMVHKQAEREAAKFSRQLEAVKHGQTVTAVTTQPKKEASVVKRAAVGAAVAGEVGAIVGAASAINENIKNSKEN